MTQTVAVTSIGGAQSQVIAACFADAGWTVRGIGRNPGDGPDRRQADLVTGSGLAEAFSGVDAVVFTLPQDHQPGRMVAMARAVATAADSARVGRLILNVAGRIANDSPAEVYATLRAVRDTVEAAAVPVTVLEPTVFMDNLLAPWMVPAIVGDGVLAYPATVDASIAWISHRSLGQAAVAAASRLDAAGRRFLIGGPEALAGADICRIIGAHLGRTVQYATIPIADFAAGLDALMGPPSGVRIAEFYTHLAAHPDAMATGAADMAALGVTPEPFADFVARSAWVAPVAA